MSQTFLDRNKKKSLLAALLLFLRERKILVLLLLLVLIASTVFLGPSSFITGLPGGARFAASVAWIAGRMGVDVSKWGLANGGRASYGDLVAAFAAAKANAAGGSGAVGWGAFFGRAGGAGGAAPNSLDMVKGSRADLEGGAGSGKDGAGQTVKGILDPADASADKDGQGVALSDSDLGGQREGFAKSAFAGGFANGLLGANGGGGSGDGALSGGAFARRGFFSGSGGAAASAGSKDLAKLGLEGVPSAGATRSKIQGAAKGSLSAMRSHAVEARGMRGAAAAGLGGNRAFSQLAEGRGRAALGSAPNCVSPGCPGEFAATNTGAIYDGNSVGPMNTSILTAPEVDGIQSPNIPDTSIAQGYEDQANQMQADAQKCKDLDAQYGPQENALNAQMTAISDQFKSADCGGGGCSKSKANHCKDLGNQLKSKCNEYMNVRCEHTHACPLTAGQNCSNECGGPQGQRATQQHQDQQHPDSGNPYRPGDDDAPSNSTVPQ